MRKGRGGEAAVTSKLSCPGLGLEHGHAWAAPPGGQAGPARLGQALPGTAASPGARGVTFQSAELRQRDHRLKKHLRARPCRWPWPGRGARAERSPRCSELTAHLSSPPKEMLQEKSLSETEEGFPTAPAPGHADSSAGSPVLGVAGGSSTPLSSPQLPDPEQVRTDRTVEQTGTAAHRVPPGRESRFCSR